MSKKDQILELFHDYQDTHREANFIPPEELRNIARDLDISVAEAYGVLSFYHLFSPTPRGKFVLRLCDSLSCRICGSVDLYTRLSALLEIDKGETTKDGLFSLEIVNCLGSCDTAPNLMVNDRLVRNLTEEKIDSLIEELKEAQA